MTQPTFIRGAIGPKVLAKADQLFDQAPATIIAELVQNARRAGATTLAFTVTPLDGDTCHVVVEDDGRGVADPQMLCTFGASGWPDDIDLRENAAGMGLYALAATTVTVESQGWRVEISPDVFLGKAAAEVVADPVSPRRGTRLSFRLRAFAGLDGLGHGAVEHPSGLCAVITAATTYAPMAVSVNAVPVPQRPFLAGARMLREWRGVTIGVFAGRHRLDDDRVNFHGHIIKYRLPSVGQVHGDTFTARVDIQDCPDLRLLLPTRDRPIETPFLDQLKGEVLRTIFGHIATLSTHTLSYCDWTAAAKLGVKLKEAAIVLSGWHAEDATAAMHGAEMKTIRTVTDPGQTLVVQLERGGGQILAQLAGNLPQDLALLEGRAAYEGYPGYDSLQAIVDFQHDIVVSGDRFTVDNTDEGASFATVLAAAGASVGHPLVCDAIETTVMVATVGDARSVSPPLVPFHSGPAICAFPTFPDVEHDFLYSPVIIRRAADPRAVADMLVDAHFDLSEDHYECGTDTDQLKDARAEALAYVRTALLGKEGAGLELVLDQIRELTWSIAQTAVREITIAVRRCEPAAGTVLDISTR